MDRRDGPHATPWSPLADDAVAQKDEAIIHVRDMGLLHVERELELIFQETPAGLAYRLCVSLGPFDNQDEIIGIAAVGSRWLPLPVFPHSNGPLFENPKVPRPSVLAHVLAQVVRFHPRIELMQHDVGQQGRK
jgi:hypothetical protein